MSITYLYLVSVFNFYQIITILYPDKREILDLPGNLLLTRSKLFLARTYKVVFEGAHSPRGQGRLLGWASRFKSDQILGLTLAITKTCLQSLSIHW